MNHRMITKLQGNLEEGARRINVHKARGEGWKVKIDGDMSNLFIFEFLISN